MPIVKFSLSAIITIALIYILNIQIQVGKDKLPCLGLFLSPQKGFWANAESKNASFDGSVKLKGLQANGDVYFDERLVPHIYANNDADAYYIQGYLHAKFRLWQMEFQTHIAAGRLSEIRGKDSAALAIDKFFRRLGMVYAAENCVQFMEKDAAMKKTLDAYTAGVNAYIDNMKQGEIPFEYKLMNYKPEHWTNLKTALFLKLMSFDLTGRDDDITYTNGKNSFGYDEFMKIFPNTQDSLDPIIPRGTTFEKPAINVSTPTLKDSIYLMQAIAFNDKQIFNPDIANGSNNWAVDSSKTKSKRPILCNDPHLGLSLPSLWYEIQITTPQYSCYGASFPGSPAIIIGFNNNIAWGVTNAGRDVKDYYQLEFKDASMQEYKVGNEWRKAKIRNEVIKIKGQKDSVTEKLAITDFGVVMFDKNYKAKHYEGKYIAVRWTAHDASNELQTFMKLNKAKNYDEYREAIKTFDCPGQNFVFASKTGDIAITQQGKFVAKWDQQGDFIMPGTDSSFMWQGFIPQQENPTNHNPIRGFVSSANQKAVDETYPYYLGRAGNFPPYRGLIINRKLAAMQNITATDIKELQTDNYDVVSEIARPILYKYIDENALNVDGKKYLEIVKDWNLTDAFDEKGATIFSLWWSNLDSLIYNDDFSKFKVALPNRLQNALADNLLHDSAYKYIDNINTTQIETLQELVNTAFATTIKQIVPIEKEGKLQWGKYRQTSVFHPTKMGILSRTNLTTSGSGNCINATKDAHGPSWRMIVHLTDEVEAYGVYPGGQSGNPGSRFYDNFVDTWVAGKYNNLLFVPMDKVKDNPKFRWHCSFSKA